MERNWWAYRFAKAMLQLGAQMSYDVLFKRGCRLWATSQFAHPEQAADSEFGHIDEHAGLSST
ncbi:hypothetical protein [Caldimonas sp. KR1-144]|uniref:hypothetical protein n=1 Tax=Caldimonas sp. KR1-144 TaxID=3400911 RepID=UPI003C0DB606